MIPVAAAIIVSLFGMYYSSRGGILDKSKRYMMPLIMYIYLFFALALLVFVSMQMSWATRCWKQHFPYVRLYRASLVINLICISLHLLFGIVILVLTRDRSGDEKSWIRCMKCCSRICCWPSDLTTAQETTSKTMRIYSQNGRKEDDDSDPTPQKESSTWWLWTRSWGISKRSTQNNENQSDSTKSDGINKMGGAVPNPVEAPPKARSVLEKMAWQMHDHLCGVTSLSVTDLVASFVLLGIWQRDAPDEVITFPHPPSANLYKTTSMSLTTTPKLPLGTSTSKPTPAPRLTPVRRLFRQLRTRAETFYDPPSPVDALDEKSPAALPLASPRWRSPAGEVVEVDQSSRTGNATGAETDTSAQRLVSPPTYRFFAASQPLNPTNSKPEFPRGRVPQSIPMQCRDRVMEGVPVNLKLSAEVCQEDLDDAMFWSRQAFAPYGSWLDLRFRTLSSIACVPCVGCVNCCRSTCWKVATCGGECSVRDDKSQVHTDENGQTLDDIVVTPGGRRTTVFAELLAYDPELDEDLEESSPLSYSMSTHVSGNKTPTGKKRPAGNPPTQRGLDRRDRRDLEKESHVRFSPSYGESEGKDVEMGFAPPPAAKDPQEVVKSNLSSADLRRATRIRCASMKLYDEKLIREDSATVRKIVRTPSTGNCPSPTKALRSPLRQTMDQSATSVSGSDGYFRVKMGTSSSNMMIADDSPLSMIHNLQAIMALSKLPADAFVSISLKNEALGLLPYFIARIPSKNAIVLSIRGSNSKYDAITDMFAEDTSLDALFYEVRAYMCVCLHVCMPAHMHHIL
jgi:hypothetical protein